MTQKPTKIKVCQGTACLRNCSAYSLERARNDKESLGLDHVEIEECPCLGKCEKGPNTVVESGTDKKLHSFAFPIEMGKIIRNLGGKCKK
jgi:NADH:ubiquinone oxidoreductase subunit E